MSRTSVIFGAVALVSGLVACSSTYPIVGIGGSGACVDGLAARSPRRTRCEGRTSSRSPKDPAQTGPWAVGAKTVTVAGYKTEGVVSGGGRQRGG